MLLPDPRLADAAIALRIVLSPEGVPLNERTDR